MTTTQTETIAGYTGFKRDLLYAIAAEGGTPDAPVAERPYGLGIKRKVESWYGVEVNHGRLYPNLDDLVDDGFVDADTHDKRTNAYALTDDGVEAIVAYHSDVVVEAVQGLAGIDGFVLGDAAIEGGSA